MLFAIVSLFAFSGAHLDGGLSESKRRSTICRGPPIPANPTMSHILPEVVRVGGLFGQQCTHYAQHVAEKSALKRWGHGCASLKQSTIKKYNNRFDQQCSGCGKSHLLAVLQPCLLKTVRGGSYHVNLPAMFFDLCCLFETMSLLDSNPPSLVKRSNLSPSAPSPPPIPPIYPPPFIPPHLSPALPQKIVKGEFKELFFLLFFLQQQHNKQKTKSRTTSKQNK